MKNMDFLRKLPTPKEIKALYPLREDLEQARSDNYNANNDKWHRLASKARENTKRTEKQIGEIDKKYKKAGEALSNARSKIKSAREANAYMKQRGTKISPLAKGGKHSWSNVRLAHFRCNTIKRDNLNLSPAGQKNPT